MLGVFKLSVRSWICAVVLLSAIWQMTSVAQTSDVYGLNAEILKRLDQEYIVDLGLSELNNENRNVLFNLSPEDLLATLMVDEGTEYISPKELERLFQASEEEKMKPQFEIKQDAAVLKYSAFGLLDVQKTANFLASLETSSSSFKGTIIDLRENTGGHFDEIKNLANLFLEDGLIFSIVGRDSTESEAFYADDRDISWGKPIMLIVDDTTASGAAIFAKSLQINGRAIVYGQPSADIGYIQSLIPLSKGTAFLKTSTHKITFADGIIGSSSRVIPDVYVQEDVLEKALQSLLSGRVD